MTEPRPIPVYPGAVSPERWFCLECVCQTVTEFEMKSHCKAHHDCDPPLHQVDYVKGDGLAWMQRERAKWIELAAGEFFLEMHPGFGPDDFVAEAEIRSA